MGSHIPKPSACSSMQQSIEFKVLPSFQHALKVKELKGVWDWLCNCDGSKHESLEVLGFLPPTIYLFTFSKLVILIRG